MENYTLYHFERCPYCLFVRDVIKTLGLDIELRDIRAHPEFEQELLQGGGRTMVPCLRIEEKSGQIRWLYESSDIIAFLNAGTGAGSGAP